jgi:hypothetical protein
VGDGFSSDPPPSGWTQQDLNNVQASIRSCLSSITYAGPPARAAAYQQLSELRKLRAEIVKSLNAETAPQSRLTSRSSGFRRGW